MKILTYNFLPLQNITRVIIYSASADVVIVTLEPHGLISLTKT